MYRKTFTFEGKRYSVSGKTRERLEENLARKKTALLQGPGKAEKVKEPHVSVAEWIEEWLSIYKLPVVSADWYRGLRKFCTNLIAPAVGDMRLSEVKPTDLQKILNSKGRCSKSYIKTIHNLICEIFQAAKLNGLIETDPSEALVRPAGLKKKPRRSLTAYERQLFLEAINGYWAELFLKFQLFCGLRPSEAAALLWSDVNLEEGVVNVNKALKGDDSIGETKTASGVRKVPLPEEFLEELRGKRVLPRASANSAQIQIPHENDRICHNSLGGTLTKASIKVMWKQVLRRMDKAEKRSHTEPGGRRLLPEIGSEGASVMYCLRHTYCTDLQAAGVPINVARELMGHSSISVTAEIYTHSSPESFQDARDKINSLAERRRNVNKNAG